MAIDWHGCDRETLVKSAPRATATILEDQQTNYHDARGSKTSDDHFQSVTQLSELQSGVPHDVYGPC